MKYYPKLFNSDMVRAVLAGRKTQTRDRIKPQPTTPAFTPWWKDGWLTPGRCPLGVVGDRLWVREASMLYPFAGNDGAAGMVYRADGRVTDKMVKSCGRKWTPSIHMFRRDSRITLEITEVRAQRIRDITDEDAIAEGVIGLERMLAGGTDTEDPESGFEFAMVSSPRFAFRVLWESLYGPDDWENNVWLWARTFKRITSEAVTHV